MVEREAGDAAAERGLLAEGIRRFPYFWKLHLMLGQLEERLGGWAGEGAGMEGRGGAGGRETGAAAGRQGRGGLVLCCHYCRMLPPPPHCKHQIPA